MRSDASTRAASFPSIYRRVMTRNRIVYGAPVYRLRGKLLLLVDLSDQLGLSKEKKEKAGMRSNSRNRTELCFQSEKHDDLRPVPKHRLTPELRLRLPARCGLPYDR